VWNNRWMFCADEKDYQAQNVGCAIVSDRSLAFSAEIGRLGAR
jgi:hypothetical protein